MTKQLVVMEPHQILDSTHDLSLAEIRVLQLTLASIWRDQRDEGIGVEYKMYSLTLSDYSEVFGLSPEGTYGDIVDTVKSLMQRILVLKTKLIEPTANDRSKTVVHWVDKAVYDPIASTIAIRFDSELIQILNGLGKENLYSQYELENTSGMSSVLSIRLFRLLNKWKKAKRTSFEVEEFRRLMGVVAGTYTSVADLRNKVINRAIKEINTKTVLKVRVEVEKRGKKIDRFRFIIIEGKFKGWGRDRDE